METEKPQLPCAEKLAFDSQQDAAATAVVVAHRYGTKVRPYRCRYCTLWHVTSTIAD